MNVWPVIVRELRQQARQKLTFTLRVVGVGAMLAAASLFALQYSLTPDLGAAMFRYLHLTLFWAIWILVPLSAADCISRERREGTLGLLFLTPLKPTAIVLAKGVAHGLRAMTLLLAILPVLTIPFLMGGVSWQQAGMAALANFSAVCWALAAALVASAGTRSGLRASVGAIVLALFGFLALAYLTGIFASSGTMIRRGAFIGGGDFSFLLGLALLGVSGHAFFAPMAMGTPTTGMPQQFLIGVIESAALSFVVLLLAIVFAAVQIRRSWRAEPPPAWVRRLNETFCTPVLWLKFFKRWMRWKIERNPIGWLEQRTWTGRLVTWTWFAIVISLYSAIFSDRNFFRSFNELQLTIAWLMMGSIGASAAGSFRRERESGVLELLLVTPLSAAHIIGGRLRGLWGQFLPAVAALLFIWLYFQSIFRRYDDLGKIVYFTSTFLTLPVIGLYFSLRCRNYIVAFLMTLAMGMLLPVVLTDQARLWWNSFAGLSVPFEGWLVARPQAAIIQLVLAAGLLVAMRRRLERRLFPLERTGQ